MECGKNSLTCTLQDIASSVGTPLITDWLTFSLALVSAVATTTIAAFNIILLQKQQAISVEQQAVSVKQFRLSEKQEMDRLRQKRLDLGFALRKMLPQAIRTRFAGESVPLFASDELDAHIANSDEGTAIDLPTKVWMLATMYPVPDVAKLDAANMLILEVQRFIHDWIEDPDYAYDHTLEAMMKELPQGCFLGTMRIEPKIKEI